MADLIAPPNPQYKLLVELKSGHRLAFGFETKLDCVNDIQRIFHGAPADGVWDGSVYYPPSAVEKCTISEPGEKAID